MVSAEIVKNGWQQFYKISDGDKEALCARVTGVTGMYPKPALPYWAAKQAAQYAVSNHNIIGAHLDNDDEDGAIAAIKGAPWATRDKAGDKGTRVHRACEDILGGLLVDSKGIEGHLKGFREFLELTTPQLVGKPETIVANLSLNYAGTRDLIFEIDGSRYLVDIKTSAGGDYQNYDLQLAAYRFAEFGIEAGKKVEVPQVDGAFILHLRPRSWGIFKAQADQRSFGVFKSCLQIYYYDQQKALNKIIPEDLIGLDIGAELSKLTERVGNLNEEQKTELRKLWPAGLSLFHAENWAQRSLAQVGGLLAAFESAEGGGADAAAPIAAPSQQGKLC